MPSYIESFILLTSRQPSLYYGTVLPRIGDGSVVEPAP